MTTMASQITSLTLVYWTVYSDADQRKHQSSASLDFVWGIHRDRWIPRTKGQLRGKCFHLMTSSWNDDGQHNKLRGTVQMPFIRYELNTLRSEQNGHNFANDIFKWIFVHQIYWRCQSFNWQWFKIGWSDNHCMNQWWLSQLTLYWSVSPTYVWNWYFQSQELWT